MVAEHVVVRFVALHPLVEKCLLNKAGCSRRHARKVLRLEAGAEIVELRAELLRQRFLTFQEVEVLHGGAAEILKRIGWSVAYTVDARMSFHDRPEVTRPARNEVKDWSGRNDVASAATGQWAVHRPLGVAE
jgi:hypothetical protein